ncbi:PREDICTED: uncharacterized protein LOC109133472 [Camelina sativa]|uniref:F-ATPase protein 6 n=1 Tax=Camelina sativa TaxID=90675 RepID=A0ABM1RT71_CAMSA|nr:PREDICTED: uncharacterized protein LOC109133472 [Camelina sativa]
MRRIFLFDENSLNSSSSGTSSRTAGQFTNFSSGQASGTQDAFAGIFEDHPGLNPNAERVVELQCVIREKFEALTQDPEKALIMAESSHGESDNIPFMESIVNDLTQNGVSGEAFQKALNLVGQSAASPLDQFEIVPLVPMNIGNFYFSFTNPSLFMLLTLSLFLLLIHFVTKMGGGNLVPNAWQSLVELLYDFVLNLIKEQIGGLSGNIKTNVFPLHLGHFSFFVIL